MRMYWKVSLAVQNQFFDNIQAFESHYKCPICLDYYIAPRTTKCGHIFCNRCIDEHLLIKDGCPVCRNYIKSISLCKSNLTEKLIQLYMGSCEDGIRASYQERHEEYDRWLAERKVQVFEVGSEIDARDTEFIWCKGKVVEYLVQGAQQIVKVHYSGWSRIYDEYMTVNSERMASRGFYTNRTGKFNRHTRL